MKTVDIVTVYNNTELASQMRSSVYSRGGGEEAWCRVILLDNTGRAFSSAAEAYNHALNQCTGDIVVFCHQDILFLEGSLQEIIAACTQAPDTLFGAAGVKNLGHGGDNRIISSIAVIQEGWNYHTLEQGKTEDVFTLDECLIAADRSVFDRCRFDEKACDGWHLYAADLCMQCLVQKIPVKVYSANIVHLSGGYPDQSFYACEEKLVKKYRPYFSVITYTCGWAYTSPWRYWLLKMYRRLRYHVR